MSLGKIGKFLASPFNAIAGDKATAAVLAVASAIPGPHQPFAMAAAAAFNVYQQITAPKPTARGSTTNVIIDAEPPRPYLIGESYSGGVVRHRVGYGPTLKKVPNPYLWEVKVFSGVGPVEALVQEQFDFAAIGSYYSGFYSSVSQLGLRPEPAALVPPLNAPATGWGASSKLSGCAAIGSNYKFDKDGKVFASGVPVHGAIWKGELAYDPRLDSTYPGGSGPCRLGDESTYVYSGGNPAIEAGMYAFGRYEGDDLVFGLGASAEGIDWAAIVDWANDCDANGWECHGTIYEGGRGANVQEQRLRNLDDICAAGGGRWLTAGAVLSFDWHRPRVSLATLTEDDLLEAGASVKGLQSVRDRMNGVRPQYISPSHNWEQITADEIIGTTYRTEDGQPLTQTWPLNLVKDPGQAGELASYAMADSREIGPIEVNAKQHWRYYRPGETIDLENILGFTGQAVILQRDLDPQTFAVRLTLKSETPGKHDFALGKVASPPPTPIIGQTQEQRDGVAAEAILPPGFATIEISSSYTAGLAGNITQAVVGSEAAVTIPAHTRIYTSGRQVAVNGGAILAPFSTTFLIYYDDDDLSGGAVTYQTTTVAADAYFSETNPFRHHIGQVTTVDSGGGGGSAGGPSTPGGGGWNGTPGTEIP